MTSGSPAQLCESQELKTAGTVISTGMINCWLWCRHGYASLQGYTVTAAMIVLVVTASYAYVSSTQSTTQTVFSFSGVDIGVWFAVFEIGSAISNILVPYFLHGKHTPRVQRLYIMVYRWDKSLQYCLTLQVLFTDSSCMYGISSHRECYPRTASFLHRLRG